MSGSLGQKNFKLVDVQRVPAQGNFHRAIVTVPEGLDRTVSCDVVICGGGLGGVAAALTASAEGVSTCLLEETDWLGGQATSQGVSALDEHDWIESFGGTRTYYEFRRRIREVYAQRWLGKEHPGETLNPGECWVSRLGFEPRVARAVIEDMLAPARATGSLQVFLRTKVYHCEGAQGSITGVHAVNLETGERVCFTGRVVIDATELGDVLPLAGIPYRLGAESREETGETHARQERAETCVQGCTYPFILEKRALSPAEPGDLVPEPAHYREFRERQPYSLTINIHGDEGNPLTYALFDQLPGTPGSVWRYRRILAGGKFKGVPSDVSMFNWPGNDYYEATLVDVPPVDMARALQRAKQLSLGLAYWIQSENPPPPDGRLKFRRDVLGTEDGLSKYPYIREARRIVPRKTVIEQDVHASCHEGVRARQFPDSVGVGYYALDVHHTCDGAEGFFVPTKPFQIPLGALVPVGGGNLIAGAKNIGVTHVTNGCYRLHPVEWNIGESAGVLAAFCVRNQQQPGEVEASPQLLRQVQRLCFRKGIPGAWLMDVPPSHPHFQEIHFLATLAGPPDDQDLEFRPDRLITPELHDQWSREIRKEFPSFLLPFAPISRRQFAWEVEKLLSPCL